MRLRKIHVVVAVSVALVVVARSIEGRRRAQDGFPAEPVGDLPGEGHLGSMTAEPVSLADCEPERSAVVAATFDAGTPGGPESQGEAELSAEDRPSSVELPAADPEVLPEAEQVGVEEPVTVQAEFRCAEPPVSASLEVESDAASSGKRRLRRGPLAVAAAVIVLIAVLAGTVVVVTAGAASSPRTSHRHARSSLHP